ncbi:MAG: FG-GAP-like repeat-containing protein [Kiritimatiellia bacterium]
MAFMKKHGIWIFVLAGLTCAAIASAETREAWSVERGASAISPAGSQSAIRNPQSAIPLQVPFIQNQGQIADPEVLFYARTFGGTVYVTDAGQLVYVLPKGDGASNAECRMQNAECSEIDPKSKIKNPQSAILQIRETLVDADLTGLPAGAERSGAVINSFIGSDPSRWQANIPSFAGVRFGEVYEGIALEVRATGDNVEKIFTVAPGADPARIALRLTGVEGVSITSAGELEARTVLGPVRFTAPVAYQSDADGERQSVRVAYALEGDQVGFCVGAFDAARPLVIDPLLASTFIGATSNNVIRAMALDSQTNVLVAGYTVSVGFPATNKYGSGGSYDGFIAKFDPQLTNLLTATYIGGSSEDRIMGLAVNTNNDNVYVAGYTASRNFPTVNPLYPAHGGGTYDAFVAVLAGDLTSLTASTYLGGTNLDQAYALALSAGSTPDVFVAGLTASTNFPIANTFGANSYQTNLARAAGLTVTNDAFVVRFNSGLSANLASTYLGGTNDDGAYGLALDTNDFVYMAGYTTSPNFPAINGYTNKLGGVRDVFVARLPVALTNLDASTFLGGTNNEVANGISVAPFTNIVCVVGYTTSTNYPRLPADNNLIAPGYTNKYMGGKDAFLTRLDLPLTNIIASTYLGGTSDDEAAAVLAYSGPSDNSLRIYVAGYTTSARFPVTTNAYDTTANGGRDAFVSYFGTGVTLNASTYIGGSGNDTAYAMALQADRFALFTAGATASTNFPATLRAYNNDRAGRTSDDGFVTKLGAGLAYGSIKWQVVFDTNTLHTAMAGSPSLGWDGSVYCGFGTNLYAFDAQGRQRWKTACAGVLVNLGGTEEQGLGTTPAVSTNGTIYVTTDTPGSLQAISPTGGIMWTVSADNRSEFSSPAIGNDGTIYFGTFGNSLYAVQDNATNAVQRWSTPLGYTIYSSPAIATNGNIFAANAQSPGLLYPVATNGGILTPWNLPGPTYSSPTFGSNGWVYIGSDTNLYGFDPNNTGTSKTWATAGRIYAAPTIGADGVIYVGGGTNLYSFYADGSSGKVWATDGTIKSSPTIAADGAILVGSENTGLYSFNPDGTTNWVLELDEVVHYNSPLIQRDGTIYMTDENNLYAIFGSAPTIRTNWPTVRHDVLHTGNASFDAAQFLKPTGLGIARSDQLDLSWDGNANADYYELFNGTNAPGTNTLLKTLIGTNYTAYVGASGTNIEPGKIYYFSVRVATPAALSDFSDPVLGGLPPLPPTGLSASKGNPTNEIVITWDPSTNATMYYLWQSMTNDTNTAVLLATTNITSFTNAPDIRGLTNYYWVQAGNGAAGTSGLSAGVYGGTPPLVPANITAGTNDYRWVNVAWSSSTGAAMYVVYRNTSNDLAGSVIVAVTNDLTFNDTTADSLRYWYYWVRATNAFGLGEFSDAAYGWRLLVPPHNVSASRGAYLNKVRVAWEAEAAASSYVIYRSLSNDSASAVNVYETVLTNYDDLDIARGAAYYYWARSKNGNGASVFSSPVAIGGTVPYPPLNVSATDGTENSPVTVTWNASAYATSYEVFRQDAYAPWSLGAPFGFASGLIFSDIDARPGQRYYYWVRAANQFGLSQFGPGEYSGFDTGYRPLAPPYAVSAGDGVSADHLYVTWSISDNASSYELWRGTNSDRAAALILVNAVPTNAYDDTGSVPGVLYYYWVKAKTTQFVSDFSVPDSGYRALRPVDIGVSDLVFLPTRMAVGGAPDAVSFRVTNYGVQAMAAPNDRVAYNFYISSNSVFGDVDAKWIGGANVNLPLAVGNSAVVVLPKAVRDSLATPAVVVPGWYYIFVNIQHAAPTKWLDPNLSNNTVSRNGGVIKVGAGQPAGLLLVNDYNGDGYTDLAMYQESTGAWQVWFFGPQGYTQGFTLTDHGGVGFTPVMGDYDGDGKADFAVYQESTGTWQIWVSAGNYAMASAYGAGGPGFEPVPGDYDGDGLTDLAVYRESDGVWRAWLSASGYSMAAAQGLGGPGWQPVSGDYDGDGKADLAVYRESTGGWQIWRSSLKYAPVSASGLGGPGYRPVVADYDLDGITDPAVFQASTGTWRIWLSAGDYAEASAQGLGNAGTVAVPGDYDGDGKADPAIYWDAFGMWRLWLSNSGYRQMDVLAWPGAGFRPVWP